MHKCTSDVEIQKAHLEQFNSGAKSISSKIDFDECKFCSKRASVLELVRCSSCGKSFCLPHRHKVDHNCQDLSNRNNPDSSDNKANVAQVLSVLRSKLSNGSVTVKYKSKVNTPLAIKVATMKLKSTAKGQESTPIEERLYFFISFIVDKEDNCFDQSAKVFQDKPIHLCRQWSVGKCVDWLASHFGLVNKNNVASEPKMVITMEQLVHGKDDADVKYCCSLKNPYICFSHSLDELNQANFVKTTDHLIITYVTI